MSSYVATSAAMLGWELTIWGQRGAGGGWVGMGGVGWGQAWRGGAAVRRVCSTHKAPRPACLPPAGFGPRAARPPRPPAAAAGPWRCSLPRSAAPSRGAPPAAPRQTGQGEGVGGAEGGGWVVCCRVVRCSLPNRPRPAHRALAQHLAQIIVCHDVAPPLAKDVVGVQRRLLWGVVVWEGGRRGGAHARWLARSPPPRAPAPPRTHTHTHTELHPAPAAGGAGAAPSAARSLRRGCGGGCLRLPTGIRTTWQSK